VILVAEIIVKLVASTEPKNTSLAPARLVPVMLTAVPPAVLPEVGVMLLIVGAAAAV